MLQKCDPRMVAWTLSVLCAYITLVSATPYDVTHFESDILPKWIQQFKLPGVGNYSLTPDSTVPHPYAPSDVLHVLCFTGQLDNITSDPKVTDEWAAHINSFQRADGFFDNTDSTGHSGGTLWHAAGYVTAGLALLKRQPLKRNQLFDHIAETEALWEPTIHALLNIDANNAPDNITSGCDSGYPCAQNIASLQSWYIMTNKSMSGLTTYRPFVQWYYKYLVSQADPVTGLWCTNSQRTKHGVINCIGGSFHIDFVFQYAVQHAGISDGDDAKFPYPKAQLNASLGVRTKAGTWSGTGLSYIDIDGIYQAIRPAAQAGKILWNEVEQACDMLLAKVTAALNSETVLLDKKGVSSSSHNLPALVACVAECGKWFPDMVKTVRPWKMCLDDVPYI
eukprot:m.41520 g.41520  ORF g.41520 m.41520 type:complete len:393 (+) comp9774_c0_seq2:31-1209(+)